MVFEVDEYVECVLYLGCGGMISFYFVMGIDVDIFLWVLNVILFVESFGGVESLLIVLVV